MKEKALLRACGLGRRKPGGEDWLLRGICLEVRPGDRLALTGPTGSGKTMLLRALAALDPHDEGSLEWEGRPLRGDCVPAYRKEVVCLHQRPALFDGNVEDNLRQPFALAAHRRKRYDRARVADLLRALKRDESFLEQPTRDLSGGEAQIVALVRCIQLDPRILLLDEPTASLDQSTADAAEALLHRWQFEGSAGRTLIWVSHDLDQARRVSDRRLHMHLGRLRTGER